TLRSRSLTLVWIGVWQYLQNREMPDRLVKFEIPARLHCFRTHFTETLQVVRVLAIDNNRRVSGCLVHDIGRGCVFDVMDLTHVARDHENFVSLKFHERSRRNKSVYCHRAPIDRPENLVHLFDPRNALEGTAGIEEPLKIDFVCVFLQKENVLAHDETPDRVIDRGVLFVTLIDCELQQMFWQRFHCLVSSAERLNTYRGFLRAHKRRFILRCLNVSSKKGLSSTAETQTFQSVSPAEVSSAVWREKRDRMSAWRRGR